ncbi:unnamed protein product [Caenorhabditis auriculariae]|uniref:Uncharacterized protein n=1 Tax=Caenorhabditis auriculariae TaxID=2777116 RepID=A0A8S1H897_9PELO|nr:unnamed protein product [Caenorhabditis auriculariae]
MVTPPPKFGMIYNLSDGSFYWLPIFIHPDEPLVKTPFFSILYVFEVMSILLTLMYMWSVIKVQHQMKVFHANLTNSLSILALYYYIPAVSRFFLLSYQLGVISIQGTPERDPILLTASFGRLFYFGLGIGFLPAVFIERCCSTIFVEDYEKKERAWITVVLMIFLHTVAIAFAFSTMRRFYALHFFLIFVLFICLASCGGFIWLCRTNKRRLERISNSLHMINTYTLSISFPHIAVGVAIHHIRRWREIFRSSVHQHLGICQMNEVSCNDVAQYKNNDAKVYFDQLKQSWA